MRSTRLFVVLIFAMAPLIVFGQMDRHRDYAFIVSGQIDLLQGRLTSTTMDTSAAMGQVYNVAAAVANGEIQVEYTLSTDLPKELKQNKYSVSARIYFEGDELILSPDHMYGDHGVELGPSDDGTMRFYVSGLLQKYGQLNGDVEIHVKIRHDFVVDPNFNFDCSDGRPQFDFRDKVPYIVGGVLAAGLITWGAINEIEAQDKHDQYWNMTDGPEAQSLYDEANSEHKQAVALMIAGGVTAAGSALLYYLRKRDYKRKTYMFETYCQDGNSIGFTPKFEFKGTRSPGNNAGLALVYTF